MESIETGRVLEQADQGVTKITMNGEFDNHNKKPEEFASNENADQQPALDVLALLKSGKPTETDRIDAAATEVSSATDKRFQTADELAKLPTKQLVAQLETCLNNISQMCKTAQDAGFDIGPQLAFATKDGLPDVKDYAKFMKALKESTQT